MSKRRDAGCYVYIVAQKAADGFLAPVKVGITGSLRARLRTLQTACPYPIDLYANILCPTLETAKSMEDCFHKTQRERHLHGEWFQMDPKHAAAILRLHLYWLLEFVCEIEGTEARELANRCFALGWATPEQAALFGGAPA